MPSYRPAAALSALLLAVTLTACSSDDDPTLSPGSEPSATSSATAVTTPGSTATGEATLTIEDFAYTPATLTVAPGTTITVTNKDSAEHDVDSTGDVEFKTKLLGKDESATFTAPDKPGTYDYICSVHPSMRAKLVVQG